MSRCSERRLAIELAQEKARGAMLGSSGDSAESSGGMPASSGDWGRWFREPPAPAAPAPLPTATPPTASPRTWWRRLFRSAHR